MAKQTPVAALLVALRGTFVQFDNAMQKSATAFTKFSRKMDQVGSNLTKGLTTSIAGAATVAVRATLQLDSALDKIRTGTGATGKALKDLQGSFRTVLKGVPDDAAKVSDAISMLNTRLGLTGKPLEDLAIQILHVSRESGNATANIEQTAKMFRAWKISTDQQSAALDTVFKISQQTGIGFDKLLAATTDMAPAAQAVKIGFAQTASILALFDKAGVDAGAASTGLTIALRKLAGAGVKDVSGALRSMIGDIQRTPDATRAATMGMQLFGKSGATMAAAIKQGTFDVEGFLKAINSSDESIQKAFDETAGLAEIYGTLRNQLLLATEPIEGALTAALQKLQPMMDKLAQTVLRAAEWFAELSPEIQANSVIALALAAALGPVLVAFSSVLTVGAQVFTILAKLGPLAKLVAGPFGILATSIAVMAALMASDDFKRGWAIISENFEKLKQDFNNGLDIIKGWATKVVTVLGEVKDGVVDMLTKPFKDSLADFQRGLDVVYTGFANLKARLLDHSPIPDIEEGVKQHFDAAAEHMGGAAERGAERVNSAWDALAKKTKGKVGEVEKEAKRFAEAMSDFGAQLEKDVVDGATDQLDDTSKRLRDALIKKDLPALKKLTQEFAKSRKELDKFKVKYDHAKEAADEFRKSQEDVKKAVEEVEHAAAALRGELTPLAAQFKDLFARGDFEGAKKLAAAMVEAGTEAGEVTKAMSEGEAAVERLRDLAFEASRELVDGFSELAVALGAPEEGIGALNSALMETIELIETMGDEGSKNSFASVIENLGNLFSGDIDTGGFKDLARGLGAIASAAATALKPFIEMGKDGGANDLQQGVIGGLAIIGGTIGAIYGGPTGAAAGAGLGSTIGSLIPGLVDTDSPDHEGRKGVEQWLEDFFKNRQTQFVSQEGNLTEFFGNILRGDENAFTDGSWAQNFQSMGDQAVMTFTGLGTALKEFLGITEDVGDQVGFILAQTFGGNLDNARLLVQQLGLDFEQLEAALLKGAIAGRISWHEFEVQMQGLAQAFTPGLSAAAATDQAVQNLIDSGGRGMEALKSLRDLGIEAKEAGVKDLEGLRQNLLQSGKFTVQQIEQIFAALKGRGVTSLDELIDVSDRVGGGIVADLESMGFAFTEVDHSVEAMNASLEEGADKATQILETFEKYPAEVKTRVVIEVEEREVGGGGGDSGDTGGGGGDGATLQKSARLARSAPSAAQLAGVVDHSGDAKKSSSGSKSKSKGGGGKKAKLTDEQKKFLEERNNLAEALLEIFGNDPLGFLGNEDKFNQGAFDKRMAAMANSFATLTTQSQSFFRGIAAGMAKTHGLSKQVAEQLAVTFGALFGGGVNNARTLVGKLNLDFEDTINAIVALGRAGEISLTEMTRRVEEITKAFQPGIEGAGNLGGAMDRFWASAGDGFEAMQGVRDIGVEGLEAGLTNLDQLRESLIAAGKPVFQVDAFIAAARKRLEQFKATSEPVSADVKRIMDMLAAGDFAGLTALEQAALGGDATSQVFYDNLEKARELLDNMPNELEFLAEASDLIAGQIASDSQGFGFSFADVAMPGLLPGSDLSAVVSQLSNYSPTAQAQTSSGSYSPASGGGTGTANVQVNYNIDARQAAAGVENELRRIAQELHDTTVKDSVLAMAEIIRRGGGIVNVMR